MSTLKKLFGKVKYTYSQDGYVIEAYAKRKDTGAWYMVFDCHVSCLDSLKKCNSFDDVISKEIPVVWNI